MPGYRDRVIRLDFSEDLSEDPEKDKQWVIIRNPKLFPPAELQSLSSTDAYEPDGEDEEGKPKFKVADPAAATKNLHRLVARLVVAARLYDATQVGQFDPETGEPVGDQPLMPPTPWGPDVAATLPLPVLDRISREFADAVNPPRPPSGSTQKKSSSSTPPSATEPGAAA